MSMDDQNASDQPPDDPTVQRGGDTSDMMGAGASNANLVYILYLVSFVVMGFTSLIGVVFAYINRDKAPDWVKTHYTFQIHTFWKGIVISILGMITMPLMGLGMLVILALVVWFIIRCVKGMQYLSAGKPVPDPTTWGLG